MIPPLGQNCHLQRLGSGRFVVTSRNTGLWMVDGLYEGEAPFQVIRTQGSADRVIVAPPVEDVVAPAVTAPQALPIWIPTLGFAVGVTGEWGPGNSYDIVTDVYLLSIGVVPPSSGLNYIWDETTTFSIELDYDSGAHTWTTDAQADDSVYTDPGTYVQSAPAEDNVTTLVISIYAPGSVLVYQIQYEYQLALTGTDPISTTVLYQLPGSAFV